MCALILALVLCSGASACGGMTQVDPPSLDPPSLELQIGPSDGPPESVLDDIEDFLVIC